jgi:hypothetical protein
MALRSVAALILLALLAVASVAQAVGPLDGVYALSVTAEDTDPYLMYLVVLQNGAAVGIAFLDPVFGEYFHGFGTLDAGPTPGTTPSAWRSAATRWRRSRLVINIEPKQWVER